MTHCLGWRKLYSINFVTIHWLTISWTHSIQFYLFSLYVHLFLFVSPILHNVHVMHVVVFPVHYKTVIVIFFFSIHSHCLNHFPKQIYVIITNLLMALNPSNHQLQVSFMYWMLTLSNAVIVGREMTSSRSKININKAGSSLLFNNTCDRRHQLDNIIFHRTMLFLSSFCEARRE